MTWRATVLTLFPEMFPGPLQYSLAGKALKEGQWELDTVPIRHFGVGKHKQVDDMPFGGGAGMVMRADVLSSALHSCAESPGPLLYMSPRGKPLTQQRVKTLVKGEGVRILCGRYEGVDQRLIEQSHAEEVSVGDYILSGGEIAAIALLDACIRLIKGVMGNAISSEQESFQDGLLEYPQYTRPAEWDGARVPDVLLSGHHGAVSAWRRQQAEELTQKRRADMWAHYCKDKKREGMSHEPDPND